jgi:hypothetical protein
MFAAFAASLPEVSDSSFASLVHYNFSNAQQFDIRLTWFPMGLTQRELAEAIHVPYQQVHELGMRSEMLVLS